LGLYHLIMFGIKINAFGLSDECVKTITPIMYRFYHLSYNLLVIIGIVLNWNKNVYKILWYFGFKILYNLLLFIPIIKDKLHSSFIDGVSFGILIIITLILIFDENR